MDRPLTLALTGDVMLGRLVAEAIAARGFASPWGDVLPLLRGADLLLINLECALTARTEQWREKGPRAFYFRADPAAVATLQLARVSFAAVANNHIADFGPEGLLETLRVLDRAGIAHAGAGRDLAEAQCPARLMDGGRRLAVVAFGDHPPAWAATPTSPGINYTPIATYPAAFASVERVLAAARQQADLVVVSLHWGPNMRVRPTAAFRAFARKVVDAGADIVWGHSAHVVQGIEIWQGKPILYDTGDLVDDYAVDPALRNDLSALVLLRVRPPHVERVDLVPVTIDHCQVNQAQGAERSWFLERVAGHCAELGTTAVDDADGLHIALPTRDGA